MLTPQGDVMVTLAYTRSNDILYFKMNFPCDWLQIPATKSQQIFKNLINVTMSIREKGLTIGLFTFFSFCLVIDEKSEDLLMTLQLSSLFSVVRAGKPSQCDSESACTILKPSTARAKRDFRPDHSFGCLHLLLLRHDKISPMKQACDVTGRYHT